MKRMALFEVDSIINLSLAFDNVLLLSCLSTYLPGYLTTCLTGYLPICVATSLPNVFLNKRAENKFPTDFNRLSRFVWPLCQNRIFWVVSFRERAGSVKSRFCEEQVLSFNSIGIRWFWLFLVIDRRVSKQPRRLKSFSVSKKWKNFFTFLLFPARANRSKSSRKDVETGKMFLASFCLTFESQNKRDQMLK